jgi:hypothetical protein
MHKSNAKRVELSLLDPGKFARSDKYLSSLLQKLKKLGIDASASVRSGDADAGYGDCWQPTFNSHGDPYVSRLGRGLFGAIIKPDGEFPCTQVSTGTADYGRANTNFIGSIDPAFMLAIVGMINKALEAKPDLTDMMAQAFREYFDLRERLID